MTWPHGARLAAAIVLYLEFWEMTSASDGVRDPRFDDAMGRYEPDYRSYTWREYGNRVGIFRILELLDRLNLPVTVAAGSAALARYPQLVAALRDRGYCFAAHGRASNEMVSSRMTKADELALIKGAMEAVTRAAGRPVRGWVAQDFGESANTPELAAQAGCDWLFDWPNDDQPYPMTVSRPLISIPNQAEWDDVQAMYHRRLPPPTFAAAVTEAFDRLHAESGRFFSLQLHPWIAGVPHRFRCVERALEHIASRPLVWWATLDEVADHVLAAA